MRGKAAIKAKWEKIKAEYGDQRHEMKGVGSGGGFVFTERVDYTKPGDTWIPIPLVAVFEVNERGKIFAWREYQIGRAHVRTQVTNEHIVCRLLLEKKNILI